jgi:DNA repair protein RadD
MTAALRPPVGPPKSLVLREQSHGAARQRQPLWDHQERGLAALRQRIGRGRRRLMLQMPTGSGKTRLIAEIALGARAKGKTVAIIVSRLDLIEQTVRALTKEGVLSVGVMQGQHPMTDGSQPVQVISAQTLGRRYRQALSVDLVIVGRGP